MHTNLHKAVVYYDLQATAAQNDITSNAACGFFKCETEMPKFVKCDFKGKKKSLKASFHGMFGGLRHG